MLSWRRDSIGFLQCKSKDMESEDIERVQGCRQFERWKIETRETVLKQSLLTS